MRTTIKQIAEHTGLSSPAVSLALTGRGRISVETRQRVAAVAQELGYRPNASAKAIRSGRFNTVSLVLSNAAHRSSLIEGYISGILTSLTAHERHLVIAELPDDQFASVETAPKLLRDSTSDGMIINYIQQIPPTFEEFLQRTGLPCICTNVHRPFDCVYFNDFEAGANVTRHLLQLGHRRIEFVDYVHTLNPALDHYSTFARYDGYASVMTEAGLHPVRITRGRLLSEDEMLAHIKQWISAPFRPTAVIAYGREAFPIYRAACELNIKVPEQLTIVNFGSSSQSGLGFPIGLAAVPAARMGQVAVEMLIEKMSSKAAPLAARAIPLELNMKHCAPADHSHH